MKGRTGALIALFVGLLLLAAPARAHDVLIVQSARLPVYEEAARSFQSVLVSKPAAAGPLQIQPTRFSSLALTDPDAERELSRALSAPRAFDLILALGTSALAALKDVRETPIVHLFVPDPGPAAQRPNVTGVSLDVEPASALAALLRLAPAVRRVGLLYSAERTGRLAAAAAAAARDKGVAPILREVRSAPEVAGTLQGLRGAVDALWMLPDVAVVTPETVQAMVLFSAANRVPILTFSERYLKQGAAVAVTFDLRALGEQAGALARRLLENGAGPLPRTLAPAPKVLVNQAVAQKLGLGAGREGSP